MTYMSQMPRRYLPPERQLAETGPEQRFGTPRPGHGTINLGKTRSGDGDGPTIWEATWWDEWPEPDADGATSGSVTFSGSREEVLTWARAQPAARRVIPPAPNTVEDELLPDRDDDVLDIRPYGDLPPRRRRRGA